MAAVIFQPPLWRCAYHIAAYRQTTKTEQFAPGGELSQTKPTDRLWKPQPAVTSEKYGLIRGAGARLRRFAAAFPPLTLD
jgi:hypothetical protein